VVLSFLTGQDLLVVNQGMSSPSVGVVEGSGGSQMTIVARIAVVWFATWKVYSIDIIVNKVIGSVVHQLRCPGDKCVGLTGSLDKAHKGLEFRQACISASNVEVSSLGSNVRTQCSPQVVHHGCYYCFPVL
jgi:hypothetical protein